MNMRRFIVTIIITFVPALILAHGGHKHVIGTVVSMNATSIVVKTTSGNVSVPLSSATKYYHGSTTKHAATAGDVANDMRVVVHLGGDRKAVEVHLP